MNKEQAQNQWLFSRSTDLSVFLGSALAALLLLAVGWQTEILDSESPEWTWITAILMIDVAHVWSTSFRVYFDTEELKRRVWLYTLVPLIGYAVGVALYSEGPLTFWKTLALLAVFHFVRQQYGWIALYRAKAGERSRATWWIDAGAIYISTLYPLAFWMTRSDRNFNWFVANDFPLIPGYVEKALFPVYVILLSLYFGKSVYRFVSQGVLSPGKDIVVATTAVCWYVGIVAFNSDYAFTVTNVIIHGVPYFALIYFYAVQRREGANSFYRILTSSWIVFLASLWVLAYFEELFWDRGVWHERGWLFGSGWKLGNWKMYYVPLLAVPQLTHYVLDGFIWKRKNNTHFRLI